MPKSNNNKKMIAINYYFQIYIFGITINFSLENEPLNLALLSEET